MTPADEIEKEAKGIYELSRELNQPDWETCSDRVKKQARKIAVYVIRERKKAVLEARIDERGLVGWSGDDFSDRRIKELTAHLSELERGRND